MTPLRACAGPTILGMVVVFVHAAFAQTGSSPAYFPYPPGVIPADVDQEVQRIQGEVDHISQQALAQWRALPINEVPQNVNKTIGNLGLSAGEEDQLVAFLKTITDGYTPPAAKNLR